MRKLLTVLLLASFIFCFPINIKGLEKEITKIVNCHDNFAVIYSDNTAILYGEYFDNIILSDVKDVALAWPYRDYYYINTDNNLFKNGEKLLGSNYDSIYHYDDVLFALNTSTKSLDLFVDTDYDTNSFEFISNLGEPIEIVYDEYDKLYKYSINDVKDYLVDYNELLFRSEDNSLYALGNNNYGSKINFGNYINSPIKLLDNVIKYDSNSALDSNNDVYYFDSDLSRPSVICSQVNYYYDDNYNTLMYINKAEDLIRLYPTIKNGEISEIDETTYKFNSDLNILDIDDINVLKYLYFNNKLYFYGKYYRYVNGFYTLLLDNIVDYNNKYYLTSDGTLYSFNSSSLTASLSHETYDYKKIYKLMENVKDISFIDSGFIIMNDNSLYAFGEESDIFNDNTISSSNIPVQVMNIPSTPETIVVKDIDLITLNKKVVTNGSNFDYFVNIFPYNATNKTEKWTSSNTNVATVSNDGYVSAVGVGTATITVSVGGFSESTNIEVKPKPSEIIIRGNETIDVYGNGVVLTADILPNETLEKKIIWTGSNEDFEFYDTNYDPNRYESVALDENQIKVYLGYDMEYGEYTITASTYDGSLSDTVTVNFHPQKNLSNAKIDRIPNQTYTGEKITPKLKIVFENEELVEGTDYSVSYGNNINGGIGYVEISGTGEFSGSYSKSFIINSRIISEATIGAIPNQIYTGKAVTPDAVIKYNGKTLELNTDYKLEYSNNLSVGKANVKIVGIGNYMGSTNATFNIVDKQVTNVVATMSGPTSIKLSWTKATNVTGYAIYRSTSKSGKYSLIKTTTSLSYNNTGLTTGRTYYYKVRAYKVINNNKSYGNYSEIVSASPMLSTITLNASTSGSTSVKLSWNKVSTSSGYKIYRSTSENGKYTLIKTIYDDEILSYNNTKLSSNTIYYYKVRAYKNTSYGNVYSNYSSINIKTAPKAVTVKASRYNYNKIKLNITAVTSATSYQIYRSISKSNGYKLIDTINELEYIDTVTSGVIYYYKVRAIRVDNEINRIGSFGSYSYVSAKPNTVSNITLDNSVSGQVIFSWDAVEGAIGYQIYYSTSLNGKYYKLATTTTNTYTKTNLKLNKKYYYKIRAYTKVETKVVYGNYSSKASITIK